VLELKHKYGVIGKKVILYVPTWREMSKNGDFNPGLDFPLLKKQLGNDYVFVYRGHHLSSKLATIHSDDFFRDFTDVSDINELYLISDVMISDYSSAIMHFLILKKPVICYAPDYDEYLKQRGLLIDLKKEFPGGVCSTQSDLVARILKAGEDSTNEDFSSFYTKYMNGKGGATEAVIKRLIQLGGLPQ
jgi:CDP-glycerol glycerophosphotransferase